MPTSCPEEFDQYQRMLLEQQHERDEQARLTAVEVERRQRTSIVQRYRTTIVPPEPMSVERAREFIDTYRLTHPELAYLTAIQPTQPMNQAGDTNMRTYDNDLRFDPVEDVPAVPSSIWTTEQKLLEAARKQVRLRDFTRKMKRNLVGVTRQWRYSNMTPREIGLQKAHNRLHGLHKAIKVGLERRLQRQIPHADFMSRFCLKLPYPDAATADEVSVLSYMGISSRRAYCPAKDTSIQEWTPLTVYVYDTNGNTRLWDRTGRAYAKKMGYYFGENNLIVAVTADEWTKWPKQTAVRMRGYKNFVKPEEAEAEIILPWSSSVSTVEAPITKKTYQLAGLDAAINSYHGASTRGYIQLDDVSSDTLTFGAEIEIVPKREANRHAAAAEILDSLGDVLDIERDGSVASGFEIVTGFGSFGALDAASRKLYGQFLSSRHGVYQATSATGLHFHVGRASGIARLTLLRMWAFEARFGALVNVMVGRQPNNYCRRSPALGGQSSYGPRLATAVAGGEEALAAYLRLYGETMFESRYSSINGTVWKNSDHTRFEWRACKSTTSYASFRARMELIKLMVEWADSNTMFVDSVPKVDDFLTRVADAPRDETVGLRRVLSCAPARRVLQEQQATVVIPYNGRREYAALNI